MADAPHNTPSGLAASAHNLLQQQLISLSGRLDRQVSQLIRLNQLSNHLLRLHGERSVTESVAEAIADVLDMQVGAVWVLPPISRKLAPSFAVVGAPGGGRPWDEAGAPLAQHLPPEPDARAVRLDGHQCRLLPGAELVNPLACRCVGRDGVTIAVVFAANTPSTAGMFEPISDETLAMLTLLAEKCAAHLQNWVDAQVIEEQLAQLTESEERLQLVLQGTNDGWWDWDLRRGTCFLSARWQQMMGSTGGERTVTAFWEERVHPQDRESFQSMLDAAFRGEATSVDAEVRLHREDGSYLPVLVRGTILRDAQGQPTRFAGSILDLSERKRYEDHIHQLAFYDPLTELPNRRLLVDRLRQSLLARARTGQGTAVVMIDVDRFKRLNDTHGHAAGDQLLRAVAERLRANVRPYDTVARLGGDEFVVVLEQLGTDHAAVEAAAEAAAEKLRTALNQPYHLEVGITHHSVSVGVSVSGEEDAGAEGLLKAADVALYAAKDAGRNLVRLFRPEMQRRIDRRSALEARLRQGFERGETVVNYQAQVDDHGRLFGAEALMRWRPSEGPEVSPGDFIPVAEESGLIHLLGEWSLETACRQVVAWGASLPAGFRVAVNLSAAEFMHPDFPDRVVDTLRRCGAPGSALRLEITEATVLTELGFAAERMRTLRGHDIEFALDDFGSGYSSLTYLRRLPVSEVKIDQSYVRRMLHDRHDAAIIRAILALCRSLGLRAVAEGIETEEQRDRLLDDGCRHFQGYLFGRPQAAQADPHALTTPRVARWRRAMGEAAD